MHPSSGFLATEEAHPRCGIGTRLERHNTRQILNTPTATIRPTRRLLVAAAPTASSFNAHEQSSSSHPSHPHTPSHSLPPSSLRRRYLHSPSPRSLFFALILLLLLIQLLLPTLTRSSDIGADNSTAFQPPETGLGILGPQCNASYTPPIRIGVFYCPSPLITVCTIPNLQGLMNTWVDHVNQVRCGVFDTNTPVVFVPRNLSSSSANSTEIAARTQELISENVDYVILPPGSMWGPAMMLLEHAQIPAVAPLTPNSVLYKCGVLGPEKMASLQPGCSGMGKRRFQYAHSISTPGEQYLIGWIGLLALKKAQSLILVSTNLQLYLTVISGVIIEANDLNIDIIATFSELPVVPNTNVVKPEIVSDVCSELKRLNADAVIILAADCRPWILTLKQLNYIPKSLATLLCTDSNSISSSLQDDARYIVGPVQWDARFIGEDYTETNRTTPWSQFQDNSGYWLSDYGQGVFEVENKSSPMQFVKLYQDAIGSSLGNLPPSYDSAAILAALAMLHGALELSGGFLDRVNQILTTYEEPSFFGLLSTDRYGVNQQKQLALVQRNYDRALHTIYPARVATNEFIYPIPLWEERTYHQSVFALTIERVFICLIGVCVFFTITLCIYFWHNRSKQIFQAAGVQFYMFMGAGCVLGYISLFTWMIENDAVSCGFRLWLWTTAFHMFVGPLVACAYRIARIYTQGLHSVRVSNNQVASYCGYMYLPQFIVNILWVSIAPLQPTIVVLDDLRPKYNYTICSNNDNTIGMLFFSSLTLFYSSFLLLSACYLAWKVRKAYALFNDAKPIALSMYIFTVTSATVLVVQLSLNSADMTSQKITFALRSGGVLICYQSAVGILFLRRIFDQLDLGMAAEAEKTAIGGGIDGESPHLKSEISDAIYHNDQKRQVNELFQRDTMDSDQIQEQRTKALMLERTRWMEVTNSPQALFSRGDSNPPTPLFTPFSNRREIGKGVAISGPTHTTVLNTQMTSGGSTPQLLLQHLQQNTRSPPGTTPSQSYLNLQALIQPLTPNTGALQGNGTDTPTPPTDQLQHFQQHQHNQHPQQHQQHHYTPSLTSSSKSTSAAMAAIAIPPPAMLTVTRVPNATVLNTPLMAPLVGRNESIATPNVIDNTKTKNSDGTNSAKGRRTMMIRKTDDTASPVTSMLPSPSGTSSATATAIASPSGTSPALGNKHLQSPPAHSDPRFLSGQASHLHPLHDHHHMLPLTPNASTFDPSHVATSLPPPSPPSPPNYAMPPPNNRQEENMFLQAPPIARNRGVSFGSDTGSEVEEAKQQHNHHYQQAEYSHEHQQQYEHDDYDDDSPLPPAHERGRGRERERELYEHEQSERRFNEQQEMQQHRHQLTDVSSSEDEFSPHQQQQQPVFPLPTPNDLHSLSFVQLFAWRDHVQQYLHAMINNFEVVEQSSESEEMMRGRGASASASASRGGGSIGGGNGGTGHSQNGFHTDHSISGNRTTSSSIDGHDMAVAAMTGAATIQPQHTPPLRSDNTPSTSSQRHDSIPPSPLEAPLPAAVHPAALNQHNPYMSAAVSNYVQQQQQAILLQQQLQQQQLLQLQQQQHQHYLLHHQQPSHLHHGGPPISSSPFLAAGGFALPRHSVSTIPEGPHEHSQSRVTDSAQSTIPGGGRGGGATSSTGSGIVPTSSGNTGGRVSRAGGLVTDGHARSDSAALISLSADSSSSSSSFVVPVSPEPLSCLTLQGQDDSTPYQSAPTSQPLVQSRLLDLLTVHTPGSPLWATHTHKRGVSFEFNHSPMGQPDSPNIQLSSNSISGGVVLSHSVSPEPQSQIGNQHHQSSTHHHLQPPPHHSHYPPSHPPSHSPHHTLRIQKPLQQYHATASSGANSSYFNDDEDIIEDDGDDEAEDDMPNVESSEIN